MCDRDHTCTVCDHQLERAKAIVRVFYVQLHKKLVSTRFTFNGPALSRLGRDLRFVPRKRLWEL